MWLSNYTFFLHVVCRSLGGCAGPPADEGVVHHVTQTLDTVRGVEETKDTVQQVL